MAPCAAHLQSKEAAKFIDHLLINYCDHLHYRTICMTHAYQSVCVCVRTLIEMTNHRHMCHSSSAASQLTNTFVLKYTLELQCIIGHSCAHIFCHDAYDQKLIRTSSLGIKRLRIKDQKVSSIFDLMQMKNGNESFTDAGLKVHQVINTTKKRFQRPTGAQGSTSR